MRNAYTLLGFSFILVIAGAWYAFSRGSPEPATAPMTTLALTSFAFENNGKIPPVFTCDGDGVSPALSISGVPQGARSLVLIVDDPDIPQVFKEQRGIEAFDHWTLFNIPPQTREIPQERSVGTPGVNGAGKNEYTGPCPPPQYEPSEHRYFFRLYAVDTMLELPEGASKADVLKAMQGHVLEQTELMGKYKRPSG
jgi:Raf kinase inhibitor-like YbhB/YbcL family protein